MLKLYIKNKKNGFFEDLSNIKGIIDISKNRVPAA
jgi:hypothetical protein